MRQWTHDEMHALIDANPALQQKSDIIHGLPESGSLDDWEAHKKQMMDVYAEAAGCRNVASAKAFVTEVFSYIRSQSSSKIEWIALMATRIEHEDAILGLSDKYAGEKSCHAGEGNDYECYCDEHPQPLGSQEAFVRSAATQALEMYEWYANLPTLSMAELVPDAEAASRTAVFSADMINGFCKEGALASSRVDAISQPTAELCQRAHDAGVRLFVLTNEAHLEHAKEFASYPPHGLKGSKEAETVSVLKDLPFSDSFVVFHKNCLSPAFAYSDSHSFEPFVDDYLEDHSTVIVVGNCTDLCLRELAMYLRLYANEHDLDCRIVIPANCAQTFDMPPEVARKIERDEGLPAGAVKPHPGDLYHVMALYEMSRNGIEVVREIIS